ncbi:hypothetical protein Salat_0221200 [Sesamum alatum]|uniref:Uncharacterized protein n=1 Tax=Sesamum alatum TaxID=300844 RepID=A0AAE1YZ06_9LAMI|nr:hypothetical protein Salat_0221200 [Sesamum alatum]
MSLKVSDLSLNISLMEEEEKEVIIPEEEWNKKVDHRLTLVGRVLTDRVYNFEATKSSLIRALNPERDLSIHKLTNNMFSFVKSSHTLLILDVLLKEDHGILINI